MLSVYCRKSDKNSTINESFIYTKAAIIIAYAYQKLFFLHTIFDIREIILKEYLFNVSISMWFFINTIILIHCVISC